MIKSEDITGIILVGGKSSRMGVDKGLLYYKGEHFISTIINAVKPLVKEIILVGNNPAYDRFDLKRVEDIMPDSGPLAAVYTGLTHSNTQHNLILSCDVPLITPFLLEILLKEWTPGDEVVQFSTNGKKTPLVALYQKSIQDVLYEQIKAGERKLSTVVEMCKTKSLAVGKALASQLKNINTPDEFRKLDHEIEY